LQAGHLLIVNSAIQRNNDLALSSFIFISYWAETPFSSKYFCAPAIFENLDQVSHAKAKLIKAENALNGVGIEVHAGAQKYFDEKGVSAQ